MLYNEISASQKVSELDNWLFVNNSLEKKYVFKDFASALAFINAVGILAEKQNHHPEIHNIYNKVQLRLSTHDSDGVTDKDFDLAKAIDCIS
jgi:4a-hydroxytetrahydrobiopterin dehydratase